MQLVSEPVLKVDGLRKEFWTVAVNDVSFEIGEGEFVGLIGPNDAEIDNLQLHKRLTQSD